MQLTSSSRSIKLLVLFLQENSDAKHRYKIACDVTGAIKQTLERYRSSDLLVQRSFHHVDRSDDAPETAERGSGAVQRALSADCSSCRSPESSRCSVGPSAINRIHAASFKGAPNNRRSPRQRMRVRRTSAMLPGQRRCPALEHRYPETLRWSQNWQIMQFQSRFCLPWSGNQRLAGCHPTSATCRMWSERTVHSGLRTNLIDRSFHLSSEFLITLLFGRMNRN